MCCLINKIHRKFPKRECENVWKNTYDTQFLIKLVFNDYPKL